MKKAVVLGSSGFIGTHLVLFLTRMGYEIVGIDIRDNSYISDDDYQFIKGDIRDLDFLRNVIPFECDEVYQLAADMGGAGYVFTGCNDALILQNSARINLNVAQISVENKVKKLFFASSACVYPEYNQRDNKNPICTEDSVYPAQPDSDYGWEKLSAERLFLAYNRNFGLDVKIARLHNVYGIYCAWNDGKEKAPAALARKVVEAKEDVQIEIWGDGKQTRSFLHINDCINAIYKLMQSTCYGPYNVGSEEMITINGLAQKVLSIAGKENTIKNVVGPVGVNGRVSDNSKIFNDLGWKPIVELEEGMKELFDWIKKETNEAKSNTNRL